ncbi:hypothetical protein [Martelella limonii]|uniref:hypothetical protein n=1 Tax=Martelella limonii TaxID=1647649 RepID=UPI00158084A6|nr:hypothetical protein [Martelella limonii]
MRSTIESQVLENIAERLESEGFRVFIEPRGPVVPDFLKTMQPDIIALKNGEKLIVEVKKRAEPEGGSAKRWSELLADHPDWKLRLVALDSSEANALPSVSLDVVKRRLSEVNELAEKHPQAAFLLAWASLEALARATSATQFEKPQSPGRIVEVLAQDGYFTPTEADALRALSNRRNRLIHGDLDSDLTAEDVRRLLAIIEAGLLDEAA